MCSKQGVLAQATYPLSPRPSGVSTDWRGAQNSRFGASKRPIFGDGPNTLSESTVSNTELSEFFGPHRVSGRELSEFLSAYYLCAKANSPTFSQNSPSLLQNSVLAKQYSARFLYFPAPMKRVRNIRKMPWNIPKNLWALLDCLKRFHRHFAKVFHPRSQTQIIKHFPPSSRICRHNPRATRTFMPTSGALPTPLHLLAGPSFWFFQDIYHWFFQVTMHVCPPPRKTDPVQFKGAFKQGPFCL